jgi:hypothetical protein
MNLNEAIIIRDKKSQMRSSKIRNKNIRLDLDRPNNSSNINRGQFDCATSQRKRRSLSSLLRYVLVRFP